MPELLNQTKLARRLKRDPARIRDLIVTGVLPIAEGEGRRARFDWDECLARYIEYQAERRAETRAKELLEEELSKSSDFETAKARRESAMAAIAELKLARMQDQLMTVDDFERAVGDAYGRVRSKLLNLAPRAAPVVIGVQSIAEAQARLEPVVQEIMDELRDTSDVPDEQEEN